MKLATACFDFCRFLLRSHAKIWDNLLQHVIVRSRHVKASPENHHNRGFRTDQSKLSVCNILRYVYSLAKENLPLFLIQK